MKSDSQLPSYSKNGGSAFPFIFPDDPNSCEGLCSVGLSVRDYFAGKALQGFLANHTVTDHSSFRREDLVSECYYIADKMLGCREAKK